MSQAPKDTSFEAFLDRVRPNWREEARACGEFERRMYRTRTPAVRRALEHEALIKSHGRGNRPW